MGTNYTELIDDLRRRSKDERAEADEALFDPVYADALDKAADAIETLSKSIDAYARVNAELTAWKTNAQEWMQKVAEEKDAAAQMSAAAHVDAAEEIAKLCDIRESLNIEVANLKKELSRAREENDELEQENTILENRLSRLLRSETIRVYDTKSERHGGYVYPIEQLDLRMQELLEIEKAYCELTAEDEECEDCEQTPDPAANPAHVTTRADILNKAAEAVSGQRVQDHGNPEDNFATIANLWTAYSGYPFESVDVAMMMALLKIARISSGHGAEDSFVDLAGYAACGGEIWALRGAEK